MKRQRVTFSLKHEEPHVNFQHVQSMRHTTTFNLFKAWRDTWQISALKHEEAQVRFVILFKAWKRPIGWLSACSRHEETQVNFQHVQSMRNIAQVSTCLRRDTWRVSALKHEEAQLRFHLVQSMKRHRVTFSLKHEEPQVNFQPVQCMRDIAQLSICLKHEEP